MSTMTVVEVLVAARALVEDPAHWCQGTFAVDAAGERVTPTDPTAARYCALGAVDKCVYAAGGDEDATGGLWGAAVRHLDTAAENAVGDEDIAIQEVNDGEVEVDVATNPHAAVLACYDAAIAAARAEAEGQVTT